MGKLRLAELTSAEARAALAARPAILLPMGSIEEQGPHAPMGDFLLADRIAALIAERATADAGGTVPAALVAPVLPFGFADYFRPVPGGIALRRETLAGLVEDMCRNLLDNGCGPLLVVNGHSGNIPVIDDVTRALKRERGVLIPCLTLWRMVPAAKWAEWRGAEAAAAGLGHGADPVWSCYRHLFPDLCRPDLVPPPAPAPTALGLAVSGFGTVRFEGVDVALPLEVTEVAPTGVFGGDPGLGGPEIGARIVAHLVETGARFVAHLRAQAGAGGDAGGGVGAGSHKEARR